MPPTSHPIRLSTAIMAHPRRAAAAHAVAASIPELSARVVIDPDPTGTTLSTARLAWRAATPDATHHLVLQDDVICSRDFATRVRAAIAEHPDAALSFFTNWGSRTANVVRVAAIRGRRWAEVSGYYLPCLALALPAGLAASFSASDAPMTGPDGAPISDDLALFDHVRATGTRAYVHVPNLVEHGELPSVAGNFTGRRLSVCYAEDPADLGAGTGMVAGLPIVPHLSWSRSGNHWLARHSITHRRWFGVDPYRVLLHHGLDPSLSDAQLHHEIGRLSTEVVATAGPWLRDLWLTAVGIGMAAASEAHADTGSAAARYALDTLAPGAWRKLLPDPVMDAIRPDITVFATRAAEFGMARVRNGTVAPLGQVRLPSEWLSAENLPPHRTPAPVS